MAYTKNLMTENDDRKLKDIHNTTEENVEDAFNEVEVKINNNYPIRVEKRTVSSTSFDYTMSNSGVYVVTGNVAYNGSRASALHFVTHRTDAFGYVTDLIKSQYMTVERRSGNILRVTTTTGAFITIYKLD